MKNRFLIFLLILTQLSVEAQVKFDIGLVGAPSLSGFYTLGKTHIHEQIWSANYGLTTSWRWKRLTLSTGLFHLAQGANVSDELGFPGASGIGSVTSFFRVRSLAIPVRVDYNIITKRSFNFFAGLGLYACNVYYQKLELPWVESYNEVYKTSLERYYELKIVDRYIAQANIGLGVRKKFNRRVSLVVRPNLLYQLRKERPAPAVYTIRLYSYTLDIGLHWTFGRVTGRD